MTTTVKGTSAEPQSLNMPTSAGAVSRAENIARDPARADRVGADVARRISKALAEASIAAANEKYVSGGRGGFAAREGNRAFSQLVKAIVVVFFAIPVAGLTLYLAFFSADQYQVESRFAVRSVSTPMGDILASIGGGASATKSEAAIVAKYINSEGMARNLESDVDISKLYSTSGDFLSRFDPTRPIEDLASYWKWKVDVSEDSSTGLITMKVAAFTPEDAVRISKAVIGRASELVNSLSEQNRTSVLDLAQKRLDRARDRLSSIAGQMAQLRNQTGVLDGGQQSKAQATLVSSLELELAKLQATKASLGSLASDSIKIRALEPQISSLREQIAIEKSKMTGTGQGDKVLSGIMTDFERLQVDQDAARKEFSDAATAFEDARIGAERQEIYLSVFMQPTTPESSTYPHRGFIWTIGIAVAAGVTFALVALARLVRDNRAA